MPPNNMTAIIWQRFGPYHVARMEAAKKYFLSNGSSVTGVEVAGTDKMHMWKNSGDDEKKSWETLFPETQYHDLNDAQIKSSVQKALDRLGPAHVAINGWSSSEAAAALNWCRKNKKSAVLMTESKYDDAPRSLIKEWLKSRVVKKFNSALAGGTPHREYAIKLGIPENKVFTGYDAVDNDYFSTETASAKQNASELRKELDLPEKYFLSSGRFLDFKNLFTLIDAYRLYRQKGGVWPLVICGGGPLEDDLKKHASDISEITWSGFQQIKSLPKYYALASAFILPSSREQWGLVVNEAMACSLPVLVSRTAGCRYDLVKEKENGFLFDPMNAEDMAKAMLNITNMLDDQRLKMGETSRTIISGWGTDRFAEMLWKAIEAGQSH